jgi:hypothetical protein
MLRLEEMELPSPLPDRNARKRRLFFCRHLERFQRGFIGREQNEGRSEIGIQTGIGVFGIEKPHLRGGAYNLISGAKQQTAYLDEGGGVQLSAILCTLLTLN